MTLRTIACLRRHVGRRRQLEDDAEGQKEPGRKLQVELGGDDGVVPVGGPVEQELGSYRQDDEVAERHPRQEQRRGKRDDRVGEDPAQVPHRRRHERPRLVEEHGNGEQEADVESQLHVGKQLLRNARHAELAAQGVAGGGEEPPEDPHPEEPRDDRRDKERHADLDDPGPELTQVLNQGHPRLIARSARARRQTETTGHLVPQGL